MSDVEGAPPSDGATDPQLTLFRGGQPIVDGGGEESYRRVRDIIGHLLQVRNLSVLVGAGASFHLGLPAIRSMDAAAIEGLIGSLTEHQRASNGSFVSMKDGHVPKGAPASGSPSPVPSCRHTTDRSTSSPTRTPPEPPSGSVYRSNDDDRTGPREST